MSAVRSGIYPELENVANELIFGALRHVTSQAAKSDVLTPWKEQDRKSREVYSTSGTVDPSIRRGMYHRSANTAQPHLNSRDGAYPAVRAESLGGTRANRSDYDHDD